MLENVREEQADPGLAKNVFEAITVTLMARKAVSERDGRSVAELLLKDNSWLGVLLAQLNKDCPLPTRYSAIQLLTLLEEIAPASFLEILLKCPNSLSMLFDSLTSAEEEDAADELYQIGTTRGLLTV